MREVKTITIDDGGTQIKVRVTPFDSYRGSFFMIKVGCLLGIPALSSALGSMSAENLVGKIASAALKPEDAKAILDELLSCCARVNDDCSTIDITPATVGGQISAPETVFLLWVAAFRASFNFFDGGKWSAFQNKLRSTWQQAA